MSGVNNNPDVTSKSERVASQARSRGGDRGGARRGRGQGAMATRTSLRYSSGTTRFERTESVADPSQLQPQNSAAISATVLPTCQPNAASVEPLQTLPSASVPEPAVAAPTVPFASGTGPAVPQQGNLTMPASVERIQETHGPFGPMTSKRMARRLRQQEIETAGLKQTLKSLQEEIEKLKKETLEEKTRYLSSLLHPMAYSIHGQGLVQQQPHALARAYQGSVYQPLTHQPPAYQQPSYQPQAYQPQAYQPQAQQPQAQQPPTQLAPAGQSYTTAAANQTLYDSNAYQQGGEPHF